MTRLRSIVSSIVLLGFCGIVVNRTYAVGWDSDDFLIGGGPNFPSRIGVFDHDLTFKGLLDPNIPTVGGLDFDAAGNLVAVAGAIGEVRVYDPSGVRIGGFARTDNALAASGDLRVAPDGTYIIGQGNQFGSQGINRFTPNGELVQQYGDGNMARVAIVIGDRLWTGRFDAPTIRVLDLVTGIEYAPFAVSGHTGTQSISFDDASYTAFFGHPNLGRILETDISGNITHVFQGPMQASIHDVTRGPNGDVFAVTGDRGIWRWRADGSFVDVTPTSATIINTSSIVWAGNVPEPTFVTLLLLGPAALFWRRRAVVIRAIRDWSPSSPRSMTERLHISGKEYIHGTLYLIASEAWATSRSTNASRSPGSV